MTEQSTEIISRQAAYYRANKEMVLAKAKLKRETSPERRKKDYELYKSWAAKNADAIREKNRERYKKKAAAQRVERERLAVENPAVAKAKGSIAAAERLALYGSEMTRAQRYRAENSAKIVAQVADWRRRNPEAVARHANNRRAKKVEAEGKISPGLQERLYKLQKGRCACCGLPLGAKFHLDHIVPLARGGTNDDINIQLLRPRCNTQKSDKDPIEFMRERGFLL